MTDLKRQIHAPKSGTKPVLFAMAWAIAMMASAALNLFLLERVWEKNTQMLVLFFGLGAFIACVITIYALGWIPSRWRVGQKFAFSFLALMLLTIAITALIFALQFRLYFAQWHDDEYSRRYMFETVFTILSAIYQFLVLALRLYLPFGLLALLGASWGLATKRI